MPLIKQVRQFFHEFWQLVLVFYKIIFALVQFETAVSERRTAEQEMSTARTFESWKVSARALDNLEGFREWRVDENSAVFNFDEVSRRIRHMYELRQKKDWPGLLEALQTDFHRSMCGIDNPLLFKFRTGTKAAVRTYVNLLSYLCRTTASEAASIPIENRIRIVSDIARAYGHSALLLNSSLAFGLYQLGTIKALHEANLLPRVIFGVSTGALAAAFLCCRNDVDALFQFDAINYQAFSQKDNSAGGSLRRKISRLFYEGTVSDVKVLLQFAKDNVGEISFSEAYKKTGRVLNIQVTRYVPETGGQATWLLNYLTAPEVLVYTAAVASCACRGMYGDVDILSRAQDGRHVKCEPASLKWCAALSSYHINQAVERLRCQFNITLFIVSEATVSNLPFFRLAGRRGFFWRTMHFFTEEFWRGLAALSRRSWLRTSFSAQLQSLAQDVTGDIVLFPVTSMSDVVKLLRNPEQSLVDHCVWRGSQQVWRHLEQIRTHVCIETALQECLEGLRKGLATGEELKCLPAMEHFEY